MLGTLIIAGFFANCEQRARGDSERAGTLREDVIAGPVAGGSLARQEERGNRKLPQRKT